MSETFKLCSALKHNEVDTFKSWLMNAWGDLAMVNYPYPASFLEPLPGWPVKVRVSVMFSGSILSEWSINIHINKIQI